MRALEQVREAISILEKNKKSFELYIKTGCTADEVRVKDVMCNKERINDFKYIQEVTDLAQYESDRTEFVKKLREMNEDLHAYCIAPYMPLIKLSKTEMQEYLSHVVIISINSILIRLRSIERFLHDYRKYDFQKELNDFSKSNLEVIRHDVTITEDQAREKLRFLEDNKKRELLKLKTDINELNLNSLVMAINQLMNFSTK